MRAFSLLTAATLAAAMPMTVEDYAKALKARQISSPEVDNFAFYVEHAGSSYCNTGTAAGSPITCGGNCPKVEANGVTMLAALSGPNTGIAAHVALDNTRGEIVVAARGSSNLLNWLTNLNFAFIDTSLVSGGQFHEGFHDAWNELSAGVSGAIAGALANNPSYRIVVTGHSLGGAVAAVAGAYLRADGHAVDIYTYGAPRVGNDVISDFISNQAGPEYRITHLDDPVPRLPPITFGYRHTSPEYWLSVSESTDDNTYPLGEIKVCQGNDNVECNASTGGLNVGAHSKYFGDVSSCGGEFFAVSSADVDPELEEKVDTWAKEDIAFVKGE
jgi:hypothetical protein